MQRRALAKLFAIEGRLLLREPVGVFFSLIFPTGMLLLFGSIYGNRPMPLFGGYGTVDISVPAYTALVLATSGVQGLAGYIAAYREQGIFRRLRATPVEPRTILAAQVLVMLAMSVAGTVLLILTGVVVFDLRFAGNPVLFLCGFVVSSAAMLALGFVLGGVLSGVRTTQAVATALFFPMIFLSGATIPREVLPRAMRGIAAWLPLTHVVTLLRGLWVGIPVARLVTPLAVVVLIGVAAVVLSSRTFKWEV